MIEEQEPDNPSTDLGEYFWFICYLPPLFLVLGSLFPLFFYAPFYGALALYSLGLCCVLRYVTSPTIILSLFAFYAFWLFPSAPKIRSNYDILWILSLGCSLWLCVQAARVLKDYWHTLCSETKEAKQSSQLWQTRFKSLQEKQARTEEAHETLTKSCATLQQQAEQKTQAYQEALQKYQRIEWEHKEAKAIIEGLREELAKKEAPPRETLLSELREKEQAQPATSQRISLQDIAKTFRK